MQNKIKIFLMPAIVLTCFSGVRATDYDVQWQQLNWGAPGAVPVSGDFDGDGLADPAGYIESTGLWGALQSGANHTEISVTLGGVGYIPVPADYDGDGKTDPAVYHQGSGQLTAKLSGDNYADIMVVMPAGGIFTSADYTGDGMADPAVFLPGANQWWFLTRRAREITDPDILAGMYSNAMVNASTPTSAKINTSLTAITSPADQPWQIWRTNESDVLEIKVVSFMRHSVATNYYRPGQITELKYATPWITVAPELKEFCRAYTGANLNLRLRQLLGLPATSANDTIVEFWVDPQYLLRPGRDPEITDNCAQLTFHTNSLFLTMQTATNYIAWFNGNMIDANYGMTNGVWNSLPWTQLGYTYDWSKTDDEYAGLSEFIIPGELLWQQFGILATVVVDSVTPAADYAGKPDRCEYPNARAPESLPRLTVPPGIGR